MVHLHRGAFALFAGLLMSGAAFAQQRTLTFNTDTSDPAPKAAFDQLIADFEAENPDVDVVVNMFDHEGYKTAIR
ncbi:MAG: carbohydrate ABC transporter substrate-binding protein, partial [Paracoccaceae bacterium]|nr:carbohydrate ABC transporter substrate-binding protein [Paracoccaceae bacterium]